MPQICGFQLVCILLVGRRDYLMGKTVIRTPVCKVTMSSTCINGVCNILEKSGLFVSAEVDSGYLTVTDWI